MPGLYYTTDRGVLERIIKPKTMKKVIFPILLFLTVLISCSKHDNGGQTINVADLPQAVVTYTNNNYPAESIYSAVKFHEKNAEYVVTLTSDEDLTFDQNGGFVGEGETSEPHGHHHGKHPHHQGVPSESLPPAITGYISSNFAGYSIKHAETDSICSAGAVTEVVISRQGSSWLKLYFVTNGSSFLMQGWRIPSNDLPQAVKDAVSSHYAGYTLTEKSEKYTLSDNYTIEYLLFLSMGQTKKHAIINEDGTLVCDQ